MMLINYMKGALGFVYQDDYYYWVRQSCEIKHKQRKLCRPRVLNQLITMPQRVRMIADTDIGFD